MKWTVWVVVALGAVGLAVVLGTYMGPTTPTVSAPDAPPPVAASRAPVAAPEERPSGRRAPMNPERPQGMPDRLARLNVPRAAPVANAGDPGVQAALLTARNDVSACHAAAAAHDPALPRSTTLTLHLGPPAGGVSAVQSVESPLGGEFDACATRVLSQMKVPANDTMSVRLPMVF